MIAKPIHVETLAPFTIFVKFNDATEGFVDLTDLKDKPVFQKWQDPIFFQNVYIDSETNAVAWDADIELCSNSLYLKLKGMTFEEWKQNKLTHASD